MKFLILFLYFTLNQVYAEDTCKSLFVNRGENKEQVTKALNCYQTSLAAADSEVVQAQILSQISYLHFFNAEVFLNEKLPALEESMNAAEKGAKLFGELYDIKAYRELGDAEKIVLAKNLYNYGTAVARYVDIKGKWEAIKRMGDIKNSMSSIIRIGQSDVAFYGAHRTLAIFHMKVPAIAGGDKEISKKYFKLLIEKTSFKEDLSRYPVNNLMYADYYFSEKMIPAGCRQLSLMKDLTDDEIKSMSNGLYFETVADVKKAKVEFEKFKCDTITF